MTQSEGCLFEPRLGERESWTKLLGRQCPLMPMAPSPWWCPQRPALCPACTVLAELDFLMAPVQRVQPPAGSGALPSVAQPVSVSIQPPVTN